MTDMNNPGERWGVKGPDWRHIRETPNGEARARGWAQSLSTGRRAEDITVWRDAGGGWGLVETYRRAGGVQ